MIINKDIYTHSLSLMVCLVFAVLCGCASTVQNQYRLPKNKKIAIVPFVSSFQYHPEKNDADRNNVNSDLKIEKRLTNELISQLNQKRISNILILDNNPEVYAGKQVNANVIICGRILRYKEREGSQYAVGSPASVFFEIKIIDPYSGNVISHYEYKETQQALSENLLTFKKFVIRKGRWVKAFDLASFGISEFVNRFTE